MDVLKRLEQALAYAVKTGRVEGKVSASGRVTGETAWTVKAGISKDYISTFRIRHTKNGQLLGSKEAKALAKVAGVRLAWLVDGEGQMVIGISSNDDVPGSQAAGRSHAIAEVESLSLRKALSFFYDQNKDEGSRHAITHFLYVQHDRGEGVSTDEWYAEMEAYASHARKCMTLRGVGAQEKED